MPSSRPEVGMHSWRSRSRPVSTSRSAESVGKARRRTLATAVHSRARRCKMSGDRKVGRLARPISYGGFVTRRSNRSADTGKKRSPQRTSIFVARRFRDAQFAALGSTSVATTDVAVRLSAYARSPQPVPSSSTRWLEKFWPASHLANAIPERCPTGSKTPRSTSKRVPSNANEVDFGEKRETIHSIIAGPRCVNSLEIWPDSTTRSLGVFFFDE